MGILGILIGILVLSIIILVHEFGHMIVAKMTGMRVKIFSFGFGPVLISYTRQVVSRYEITYNVKSDILPRFDFLFYTTARNNKKISEGASTTYQIGLIPIGGFVSIKGSGDVNNREPDSFFGKGLLARLSALSAGALMNFFLAIFALSIAFSIGGTTSIKLNEDVESFVESFVIIDHQGIVVQDITEDSPAEVAGVKRGDRILTINGTAFNNHEEVYTKIDHQKENDQLIEIVAERDGESITFNLEAVPRPSDDEQQGKYIGVSYSDLRHIRSPVYYAPILATLASGIAAFYTIYKIPEIVKMSTEKDGLVGPIGIVSLISDAAKKGTFYFFFFIWAISFSIGLFNLFPIPILDGGHICFAIFDSLRSKPVSNKTRGRISSIFFYMLLILMIFATYQDIIRLFKN